MVFSVCIFLLAGYRYTLTYATHLLLGTSRGRRSNAAKHVRESNRKFAFGFLIFSLRERLLRERNRLNGEDYAEARWLDSVEAQLAQTAVAVAAARNDAIAAVRSFIESTRTRAPDHLFPWADVVVDGELEQQLIDRPAVQIEDEYRTILRDSRGLDRAAGRTLRGPHRADLLVSHGPRQMQARLCSTGEQKALLVGLVLAQARAVRETFDGVAPLLLLDEIAAHLDEVRRAALMEELLELGCQTWMTGTDRQLFEAASSRTEIYEVADGTVGPKGSE